MAATYVDTFVGRRRELDEVLGILATIETGNGRALLITGESGIGKTALAERSAAYARGSGFRVAWASALEDMPVPGYWAWRELLAGLEGDLATNRVAWPDVGGPDDVSPSRMEVAAAIRDRLRQAAERQPLLIVVDDAQWFDSASAQVLRYVAKHLAGSRVGILATARQGPASVPFVDSGWRRIELRGLGEDDIYEFLQGAGAQPDATAVADVLRSSGGNALYVRELSRLRASGAGDQIPDGLRGVVLSRLDQLRPGARNTLEAAAAAGFQFDQAAVVAVSGDPAGHIAGHLVDMERAGLVQPVPDVSGRWRFAHDLTREVVVTGLSDGQRRELHDRMGGYLAGLPGAREEDLARHYRLAGRDDLLPAVVELERRAAARAFATAAFVEAADLNHSAASAARATGDEAAYVELTILAGEARRASGTGDRGRGEFAEAMALVGASTPDLFARCVLGLEPGRMDLGFAFRAPDPEVVRHLRDALAMRDHRDPLAVRLMARLAAELYFSGDRQEALQLSREAVAAARAGASRRALVDALATYHDIALVGTPQAQESLAVANELVQVALGLDDDEAILAARLARMLDLLALGRRTEVELELAAFDRSASASGRAGLEWFPMLWRAMLAIAAGRLEEGEQLRLSALQAGFGQLGELAVWNASFQQYFLCRETGNLASLEAITRAFVLQNPEQPALACGLAYLLAETGRPGEARVELDRLAADAFAIIRDRNWPVSWYLLAQAAVLTGSRDHARELYRQGLPFAGLAVFSSIGATWVGTFALELGRLAGFLADPAADGHLAEADRLAREAGFRPWILEARLGALAWGHQPAAGDRISALEEVIRLASDAGLSRIARHARAILEATSAPRSAERAPGSGVMERTGRTWALTWAGVRSTLPDAKGLMDIAMLLRSPGSPVSAVELMSRDAARPPGPGATAFGAGLERVDQEALRQYRDHLRDLDADIAEAERFADGERLSALREEREFLLDEVRRAVDLGGRPRRERGDAERARKAVEMRISFAISRVRAQDPVLGQHLERSIRTGGECAYQPETPVAWEVRW
jgi:hypothetical protein